MNCDGREWINIVVGMVLVALGLLFLVAQLFNINVVSFTWPFFIIVPGMLFFVGMMLGGKRAGGLAIPGSIVTMVGLILLYQNSFNHFQSWAYAWALVFPTAVGVGLMVMGAWSGDARTHRHGRGMVGWGLAIFAAGALFFELGVNISGFTNSLMGKIVGPGLLIAFGLYLIVRRSTLASRRRETKEPPANVPEVTPTIAVSAAQGLPESEPAPSAAGQDAAPATSPATASMDPPPAP